MCLSNARSGSGTTIALSQNAIRLTDRLAVLSVGPDQSDGVRLAIATRSTRARRNAGTDLSIELEDQPEHSVRCWMLGSKVDCTRRRDSSIVNSLRRACPI